MTQNEGRRGARRQARGLERQNKILDAAASVFAEVGYEEATTNAIAARAGISPGSLYQFFPNKAAIGNALARRYTDDFIDFWRRLSAPEAVMLAMPALVDYVMDPLVAFTREKAGFEAVFSASEISPHVAALGSELHDGIIAHLVSFLAARAPHLAPERCQLIAEAITHIYKAFMPAMLYSDLERGNQMVMEMKAILCSYLTSSLEER